MKVKARGIAVLLAALVSLAAFSGCGTKKPDFNIDSSVKLDPDVDSWLQIDEDDEDVEITWWVDATSWDFYQIASLIEKRTGVRVNFKTALKGDGTELSTMIAGDNLPDVITLTDESTRIQLFESYDDEKYLYSITDLANVYAPSLNKRIPSDASLYLSASDGKLYGLSNNFYSTEDMEEFKSEGNSILSNYAIEVRKDWLEAYISAKKSADPSFDEDEEVTTQQGFVEMCKWVKQKYGLENSNPTVLFAPFPQKATNGSISETVSCLSEYFCVPQEDAEGNLVYTYDTPEFLEVLQFMNALYREKLVLSANFGYSSADIISHIKNGRPFAVIGAAHNYSKGFAGRSAMGYDADMGKFDDAYEYVPVVVTNGAGDAPVLLDLGGKGYRTSMITTNCARPDRVIKMFDYLMSEQGQAECYYGEEGKTFRYVVKPGETVEVTKPDGSTASQVSTYGKIEWTDSAKEMLGSTANTWYGAGLKQISLLQNPMYVMMTSLYSAEMDTYQFYCRYAMKAPLIPYTYPRYTFKYPLDFSDINRYLDIVDISEQIEAVWIRYLPSIVMAGSAAQAEQLWKDALKETEIYGAAERTEFHNRCFKSYKEKLGIEYAWAPNRSDYRAAAVKLRGYAAEYAKEIPDYIKISE
ncbi:MAG: extracellular solute-binding protein [Clostridia bacterium]|nr:extracellular solute-binding protein [Clostridia bacterium]